MRHFTGSGSTKYGVIRRLLAIFLATAGMASMLSGCYFLPKEEEILAPPLKEPEEVTYKTYTVEKGTLERWIKGTGYAVSTDTQTMMYKSASGRLKELYVKSGDTVTKGQLLCELETGDLSYNIQELNIAYQIAQVNLSSARSGGDANAVSIAKLNLQLAKLRLDRAKEQLDEAKLYAPIDGVVVYALDVDQGTVISPYTAVVRISDPTKLVITFTQDDVDELKMGMKVDIAESSKQDVTYQGEIIQTPDNLPADATDIEKKSVRISVKDMKLKLGDTVYISLLLDRKEDVIVLPISYISRLSSRRYVRVLVDGIPEERDVELGLQTTSEAEITSGLSEGDVIIIE